MENLPVLECECGEERIRPDVAAALCSARSPIDGQGWRCRRVAGTRSRQRHLGMSPASSVRQQGWKYKLGNQVKPLPSRLSFPCAFPSFLLTGVRCLGSFSWLWHPPRNFFHLFKSQTQNELKLPVLTTVQKPGRCKNILCTWVTYTKHILKIQPQALISRLVLFFLHFKSFTSGFQADLKVFYAENCTDYLNWICSAEVFLTLLLYM